MHRVIFTKYQTYILPTDTPGVPIEEYFPDIKTWPEPMRGAKVYETSNGPVIAVPESQLAPAEPLPQRRSTPRSEQNNG